MYNFLQTKELVFLKYKKQAINMYFQATWNMLVIKRLSEYRLMETKFN